MMAEVNETKIIVDYLLASNVLGTRIYGDTDVPPNSYKPVDGSCVCLKVRGGIADDESDAVKEVSVQFKIYAADPPTARSAARTLHGVFQNARNIKILTARRETQPVTLDEPENGWIYALVFYGVMFKNVA